MGYIRYVHWQNWFAVFVPCSIILKSIFSIKFIFIFLFYPCILFFYFIFNGLFWLIQWIMRTIFFKTEFYKFTIILLIIWKFNLITITLIIDLIVLRIIIKQILWRCPRIFWILTILRILFHYQFEVLEIKW